MIMDILVIIASLPTTIAVYEAILIGRIIQGITVGVNSVVVPMFVKEISPIEVSGKTGSYH